MNKHDRSSKGPVVRPKILLLAYSISPVRGSEYSVGWNHVTHLSEFCDITVLYGLAGPHMGDVEEVEDYLKINGELANVRFVPIRPNGLARLLNAPNRAGYLVYSFYLAYRIWHLQAASKAREIMSREHIDLIHYLCPIGYREPGYLWKLDRPYIWGPVGGLPNTLQLRGAPRPRRARLKVKLKNFLNWINLATAHRVSRALRRASTIITSTSDNGRILRERFNVVPILIQENAIPDEALSLRAPLDGSPDLPLRLIWIGSLDWRKSPDLLLDALAAIGSSGWKLDIIGSGVLRSVAEARVTELGLTDNVIFHGQISRTEVEELLKSSDIHLITSMLEANTTVIWEAMAAGVPTLTLDQNGMHDVVCEKCGVRVPTTDYAGTRDRLAAEIEALISNRDKLTKLVGGLLMCREQFLWSQRSLKWLEIYEQAIERARA